MTDTIYRVTIHGRTFESRDLRQLLARAVSEKRNMDRTVRLCAPAMRSRGAVDPANAFGDSLAAQF